jgi:ABC-type Na+ transport system ATPase subunit NatA
LVLGAPRALFEATTGLVPVMRGTIEVRGDSPLEATKRGVIAGAAMDPPLPPRWTVTDYISWSARLSGLPSSDARASAEAAIVKLQLGPMVKTPLARLVPHARRATVVAAALATRAEVIAVEDPLGGLADDVATTYAKILVQALEDRAWLVFAPRMGLTSPLALAADEAVIAAATHLEMQGTPAEIAAASRCFVGRIFGAVSAIAPALERRGAHVEERGAHLFFDLGRSPDMTTTELMAICASADVAVLELLPAVRALS